MDGNGRWAKKRFLPRVAGHRRGLEAVREIVSSCAESGVEFLTLFAFSSENWRRPKDEVSFLMELFMIALKQEVAKLHKNNICLKVIGDLSGFESGLIDLIKRGEETTASNTGLTLTIAANYGGRWDILQAVNQMVAECPEKHGNYCEADLARYLALSYAPEPDLFIRTGGEQRIRIFYSGNSPTPSFFSQMNFGRISIRRRWVARSSRFAPASVALVAPVISCRMQDRGANLRRLSVKLSQLRR